MKNKKRSTDSTAGYDRRSFLKGVSACSALAGGVVLGVPPLHAEEEERKKKQPPDVQTNIDDFMKVPRSPDAIPGPFPGRVVQVKDERSLVNDKINAEAVSGMVSRGIPRLTGREMKESFKLFFKPTDIVGLKVNPVGPPLINTRLELVEAMIRWLADSGLPRENIIIWDRFKDMLDAAGYTSSNFPGVKIEALQIVDEKREKGKDHASIDNFDRDAFYFAEGIFGKGAPPYHKDDESYLNQHVFKDEHSYFGKLVTQKLTKIINLPAFKNTGNGISMATKNLGYAVICNSGRLHRPLFFRVCTEVLAAPWVRDKLVLNITDGIRGQYDGGPGLNAQFVYPNHSLYFATDPFALDMVCHEQLKTKRKDMNVKVDEHPRYTAYLHQAEALGLGIADMKKIEQIVETV